MKRQLPDIPFLYTFFFPKGSEIEVNGKKLDHIMVENFTFDKSLAPEGKTVLKVAIRSGYHQWKELKSNSISDYNKKKQEVADRIIDALEMRFKGIRNDIEMIDTSTPVTVERYTNNFMGAQPWMTGETSGAIFKEQFMTIPKLYGFYHGWFLFLDFFYFCLFFRLILVFLHSCRRNVGTGKFRPEFFSSDWIERHTPDLQRPRKTILLKREIVKLF